MKLYNTLSKQKEEFVPINKKKVNMFVCGPTVYDYLHIGNARTAITMDTLSRFLRYQDYDVNYIMNITDVDDKVIKRAHEQGVSWRDLANKFEKQYLKDMEELNAHPDKYVRATDHIKDIIKQVQTLIDKGYAYTIDGDGIYFEISKFKDYGKLSGRTNFKKDDARSRIDHSDHKRGWNDFALWKFKREGDPHWDAPFGEGRPGWHIEDTAITEHYFGSQYDIHGGGSDLIFPHHEAELTQMEASSGKVPFVKYWTHTGLLYTSGKRMGKSNKNFLTIYEVTNKYDSNTIRLMMLSSHYRNQLDFSKELLDSSKNHLNRWLKLSDQLHQENSKSKKTTVVKDIVDNFVKALEDDLNTPGAIAIIDEFFNVIAKHGNAGYKEFLPFLNMIDDILGINLKTKDISIDQKKSISARSTARSNNDFEESDKIRDQLLEDGLELNDNSWGQTWSRVR